jgi:DNA polymerase III delta prime subunit
MKELLTVSKNLVLPSAYALTLAEFKCLKTQELGFVYFYTDYNSPYAVYDKGERKKKIEADLKIKYNPKIRSAIDKYAELSETSAIKLLKAARSSVNKLETYFETINLDILDDNGKPIYSAKDLITNLSNMGKVVNGLEELEELVQKQQAKQNPNRGGVVTNKYSQ